MSKSPSERRKNDLCPICRGSVKAKMTVIGGDGLTKYIFYCKGCDLGFQYGYYNSNDDEKRELIVQSVCPLCHEDHTQIVIGEPQNDCIPCPECWYFAKQNDLTSFINTDIPEIIV